MLRLSRPFSRLTLFSLCGLIAVPAFTHAARADDKTVHITRPIIQAEGETADFCLEMDHDFAGAAPDTKELAAKPKVQVTLNDEVMTLASKNLTLAGNQLCLRGLEHRAHYHLRVDELRGADGFYMKSGEKLNIDIPPRTPALSFPQTLHGNGMIDWGDDIALRSINTYHLTLELYAVNDTSAMADAWQQRLQTTLAPSESATFARTHGTLMKKWDMAVESKPDTVTTTPLPLNSLVANAQPGLYLLAVTAPDDKTHMTDLPPSAAVWLNRGTLNILALRDAGAITVISDNRKEGGIAAQVKLSAIDNGGHVVASGETDATGTALLHLPSETVKQPVIIVGQSAAGDIAFAAPAIHALDALKPPLVEARIHTHQSFYRPGDTVTLDLLAEDVHGHPVDVKDSVVQILNTDNSVYAASPVRVGNAGHGEVSLTAPTLAGLWKLVWQMPGEAPMAETALRVTHHPDAPVFVVESEQTQLPEDGKVVLHVRSLRTDGTPAPFVSGVVRNDWQPTRHPFAGWDNVEFGAGFSGNTATKDAPQTIAHFVTDARGQATLYLKVNQPANLPIPAAARLRADDTDENSATIFGDDIAASAPILLPVKPHERLVGVRATQPHAHFAENGTARFDVVVVNPDGKRVSADDLSYRIYERGRSFAWHQADGRWDYALENQARLISSHDLYVPPSGPARIEWPVTSGMYRLDVLDSDEHVTASLPFSAGWKNATGPQGMNGSLTLTTDKPGGGGVYKIHFNLEKPALITAIISDDQLRQTLHMQKPAGKNEISLTPGTDWGHAIAVHISATAAGDDIKNGATWTGQTIINTGPAEKTTATPAPQPAANPVSEDAPIPGITVLHETILMPQQSLPHDATLTKTPGLILESSSSLGQAPAMLAALLQQTPVTAQDLVDELNALRAWRTVVVSTGMMNDTAWQSRLNRDVERLLIRQSTDGSFDNNLLLTAAGVMALSDMHQPAAISGRARALGLLHRKLGDSWMQDEERPIRAAIYAALAHNAVDNGTIDPAGLRYFSDTSQDKDLPHAAAAQLAYAFQQLHDDDHARAWLSKASCATANDTARLACLPYLALNPLVAADDVQKQLADVEGKAEPNRSTAAALLMARAALLTRHDAGIRLAGTVTRTSAPTLKNNTQQPVYLTAIALSPVRRAATGTLQRHLYHVDGSDADSTQLQAGATYVMVISSGDALKDKAMLSLPGGGLLEPASCAIAAPDSGDFMGWLTPRLNNQPSAATENCEWLTDSLQMKLSPQDRAWSVISLWRAQGKGQGLLPSVTLHTDSSHTDQQSATQKIIVR